jgi:hypothetical protein
MLLGPTTLTGRSLQGKERGSKGLGLNTFQEAEKAAAPKGYSFAVGCSVQGGGNGEILLTSPAEGANIRGGVRSGPDVVPAPTLGTAKLFAGKQVEVDQDIASTQSHIY